eukprot:6374673-Pyramimonas_sp.AAC.1
MGVVTPHEPGARALGHVFSRGRAPDALYNMRLACVRMCSSYARWASDAQYAFLAWRKLVPRETRQGEGEREGREEGRGIRRHVEAG